MAVKIKSFEITGNYSPESVSSKIAAFLRSDKETETQLASYSGGYVLQAGKRSFLEAHGQRVAVTARFEAENGTLNVAAGEGLWSQKLGESKTGWFLADTSGLGTAYDPYESKLLIDKILTAAENITSGKNPDGSPQGHADCLDGARVVCSKCGTENRSGAKFCKRCGCVMAKLCPACGARLASDSMFCAECGTRIV